MKKIFFIGFAAILMLFLFWSASVLKSEIFTKTYGHEFLPLEDVRTASKFKVLAYRSNYARIYCVNTIRTCGTVFECYKQNGIWIYNDKEDPIWSKHGSAEGFVWSYITDSMFWLREGDGAKSAEVKKMYF